MKAKKQNRVYPITTEAEANHYQKLGFDIISDKGEIIKAAAGKTVPYEEHQKVLTENEALREELTVLKAELTEMREKTEGGDPLKNMSVEELKAYAEANGIDIGNATSQNGILSKIKAAGANA